MTRSRSPANGSRPLESHSAVAIGAAPVGWNGSPLAVDAWRHLVPCNPGPWLPAFSAGRRRLGWVPELPASREFGAASILADELYLLSIFSLLNSLRGYGVGAVRGAVAAALPSRWRMVIMADDAPSR